jgi:hypothetical protein
MKILLQNTHSQLFFRYGSVWTSNPEVAYDFRSPQAVFEHVQRESLGDVQLVVRFENPERYEIVPLEPVAAPAPFAPLSAQVR